MTPALRVLLVVAAFHLASLGCAAIYPEVKTPLRDAPSGRQLHPAPPNDVRWIAFNGATIPVLMRDGRRWGGEHGLPKPDPYARLLVNGVEILRTKVERGTLEPSWQGSEAGNFRVRPSDRVRVEVWDARVLNDHPIGARDVEGLADKGVGDVTLETDGGVVVRLAFEPARARLGYGFSYELRTYDVFVTRVFAESPASRAGLGPGDQLISVDGRVVRQMGEDEVRSWFNTPRPEGITVSVRREDGSTITMLLQEGAIYPLHGEVEGRARP